ncbi:MAG: hypothetical protein JWM04_503 [Verrucomicrobiales bacterium]|nr:hypothetical protein [Verrucomicrobiales bacterium]
MAKLVVLSEGLTGRAYELKVEKTTIGRLEDNAFQIPEASVSSHHCEVILKGNDVVVKDLNSTNGTFINGSKVTEEAVLKAGQILRLGQIEIRLESGDAKIVSGKKIQDGTMVIPQGVKLGDSEKGTKAVAFEKDSPFAKKKNNTTKAFIVGAVVTVLIVIVAVVLALKKAGGQ